MAKRLYSRDAAFQKAFAAFLGEKREASADVSSAVETIIADVRARGDEALFELTAKFDKTDLAELGLKVSASEIDKAVADCPADTLDALAFAQQRIADHHQRQLPESGRYKDDAGVELGHRWTPVDSVGLYVPGGLASYPSSVLMNAVPAKVAGVKRVVMVVPSPNGVLNPLVLAAAKLAGVEEIYRIGGAQAVAALAYGTASIEPVVKIVGPGNAYVAAAKRLVFGTVGIDSIAGPSEVLVIADRENNPDWIAADLLAQAEHDPAAQSILMTDDESFAEAVEDAVIRQLSLLPKSDIASASWRDFGAVIILDSLDEAPPLANLIAAEHLEIATADAEAMAAQIHNAGAIFIGAHTPEVIGDYVSGSNHVLPTARSARRVGLHETHVDLETRRCVVEGAGSRRHDACSRRRAGGASQVRRHSHQFRRLTLGSAAYQRDKITMSEATHDSRDRLIEVTLDEDSIAPGNANIQHEREVAIYDLVEGNSFKLSGRDDGPYRLELSILDDRLVFDVRDEGGQQIVAHHLSLKPLKRLMKDYFIVLDSYYEAVRTAQSSRIQAIDVGRRGLHDEGSKILTERLEGKIEIDPDTSRRLFTLLTALHWKG